MSKRLTQNFLDEVFRLAFSKRIVIEVLRNHLKFSYIPEELPEYKFILKSIISQYELTGKLPSFGVTTQQYQNNPDVLSSLAKIKNAEIIDTELALKQLHEFIRDVKFQMLFENVYTSYNKGEKDNAMKMFIDGSSELSNFTLKENNGQFLKVFADFRQNQVEKQIMRENDSFHREKVPFGICALDSVTDGGMDPGDTALWIMPSGKGKSTVLKWTAMYDCRLGYDVLHIQLEGSKQEAYDKYSQIWTGSEYRDIKWGDIPRDKMLKLDAIIEDMADKNNDIEIFAFEQFGSASIIDIRNIIIEYFKINGKYPDLVVIDSLDLIMTGENKKMDNDPAYTKYRLQLVAQRMKDIATEFNIRILTATQTHNIALEKMNNPDWVITRDNTEGDRTLIKPFAHVFTGNFTMDETKKHMGRIFIDKLRYYDPKDLVYPICTAFNFGKFYDKRTTWEKFSTVYNKLKR